MKRRHFLGMSASPLVMQRARSGPATAHGAVATVHPLATEAAVNAMKSGGNAVDGAVAAALTLGVVDAHNSGLGGGLFLLIRKPDGGFVALDGRETAPAAATRDMFVRDGKADPELSQTGALAVAVPGALAALDHASKHFGTQPLKQHLLAAAEIAERGFVPDRIFRSRLRATTTELERFPEAAAAFLRELDDGKLRLPELSASYRSIADHGAVWFYDGPFAAKADAWMRANGGVLTAADLTGYRLKEREPVRSRYRGHDVVGFPPPSSGGVHVAQILNILEHFDLRAMGDESADFVHVVAEAMKLAFADRAHWLGDAGFAAVPRGLMAPEFAAALAARIDRERATAVEKHGDPPNAATDIFSRHTTHFSLADEAGWWVACTATINTSFGSKVVVPGTGIVLNNEMDDFSAQPGSANAFGLVGAEANAIVAGKRPLSSMSPTIVLKNGNPLLALGAAGGPTIISQVVLAIVRAINFESPVTQMLEGSRFHQQWRPDELRIEETVPECLRAELRRRGHSLDVEDHIGASQVVGRSESAFRAAHDPRVPGQAIAW
ncbi:MAG: gamma-glutamyltransferase [Verrucomicrobiales bacterium]